MNDEEHYSESEQQCQWHRAQMYPSQCPKPGLWSSLIPISLCQHHRRRMINDVGSAYLRRVNAIEREWEAAERARRDAETPNKLPAGASLVYYVQRHDGAIKIGVTTNLSKRLATFGSVTPVTLLATMRGTRDAERAMHRRFASDRIHGEWFNPSPALMAHIELLQQRAVKREAA